MTDITSYQSKLRATRETKLLEFLYESFPEQSRKSIKSLLEQRRITICNQIVTKFDYPLVPGDGCRYPEKEFITEHDSP